MAKRKAERVIARPRKRVAMKKQKTPFGDTGSIIGKKVGGFFGISRLGKIGGRMLGSGIGKVLFGSGAYESNLETMQANSIINPQATPAMMSGSGGTEGDSVVIRKTEFIQDIVSDAVANTLDVTTFALNPGNSTTFPFLSSIARNFEEYRFRGAVFHFKSLSGDSVASVQSGLGYVAMATQYDSLDTVFATKAQIENYSMSQSGKPSIDQLHGIECASHLNSNNHLYIRPSSQPSNTDIRLYDIGKTTIMTSCPGTSVTLGELWVTYDVELFKPKLPEASLGSGLHVVRSRTTTTTLDFGSIGVEAVGQLASGYTGSTSTLTLTGLSPSEAYLLTFSWECSAAVTTLPVQTVATGTVLAWLPSNTGTLGSTSQMTAPAPVGTTSTRAVGQISVRADATGTIVVGTATGIVTSGTFGFNFFCVPIDSTISA